MEGGWSSWRGGVKGDEGGWAEPCPAERGTDEVREKWREKNATRVRGSGPSNMKRGLFLFIKSETWNARTRITETRWTREVKIRTYTNTDSCREQLKCSE